MKKKVAVIGAGASGLVTLKLLISQPGEIEVTGFERAGQVGGVWVYTDKTGIDTDGLPIHTSMYQNVRESYGVGQVLLVEDPEKTTDLRQVTKGITNTPRLLTEFEGFSYKTKQPSFLGHEEVLNYLQGYAEHFQLHQFIKFKTLVTRVRPLTPGSRDTKWEVMYCNTGDQTNTAVSEFDYVVVCNG